MSIPRSVFEDQTFSFIREWLSEQEKFTIQTSGSTGTPKMISVTREQMTASARLTEQAVMLKRSSNALVCIDTKHIGGRMMLVRSFVTGMRIWALDPSGTPLQKLPVDHCVNFAAFVPYQIQSMLGSKHPHLLNNLDVSIIGGAPLDEKIIEQLQHYLCRCYATYGMTETISHIALRALNGKEKSDDYHALPGIKLQKDERGCLVIDASFLPERIITNDLVEIINPGVFRWVGRWDNVINSGGVKIIPEKIEAALKNIFTETGLSNRFFIQGLPDETFGQKVVLVIEASDTFAVQLERIIPLIASSLPPYERPREVLITQGFALTESGKINRVKTVENSRKLHSLIG
jgi:O-succinylbenzoic acid--CoA ligase